MSFLMFSVLVQAKYLVLWTGPEAKECGYYRRYQKVLEMDKNRCEGIDHYHSGWDGDSEPTSKPLPGLPLTEDGCVKYSPVGQVLPKGLSNLMGVVGKETPFVESMSFVRSFENQGVRNRYGKRCAKAIEAEAAKGPLFLDSLYSRSRPVEGFPFNTFNTPDSPYVFYHYTDKADFYKKFHPEIADREQAHTLMIRNEEYQALFNYNRNRGVGLVSQVLYAAEDPLSSSRLGRYQIKLWIHPKARILGYENEWPPADYYAEVRKRYPKIAQVCLAENLVPIFAEGSGIALYDYYDAQEWFTLTSMGFVTRVEVRDMGGRLYD